MAPNWVHCHPHNRTSACFALCRYKHPLSRKELLFNTELLVAHSRWNVVLTFLAVLFWLLHQHRREIEASSLTASADSASAERWKINGWQLGRLVRFQANNSDYFSPFPSNTRANRDTALTRFRPATLSTPRGQFRLSCCDKIFFSTCKFHLQRGK